MKLTLPELTDEIRKGYPYYTDGAIQGILLIESLSKRDVLRAMCGTDNEIYRAIFEAMGTNTNPNWIINRCLERAYDQDWIDECEFSKRYA